MLYYDVGVQKFNLFKKLLKVSYSMDQLLKDLKQYLLRKFSNINNIEFYCDDIIHDTYLIFVNRTAKMGSKEVAQVKNLGYLAKIAQRVAIKLYNYEKRSLMDLKFEELEDTFREADQEITELLRKGQDLLNDMEIKVLEYRYYKEYSFSEISELCDIKVNTLLSHHRRALQKLRPFYNFAHNFNKSETVNDSQKLRYYHLLKR